MESKSERSLYKVKNLVEQDKQFKRYMRLTEAMRNYQLDRRAILKLAVDAGALYKINTITLIDMDLFEEYFEINCKVKPEVKIGGNGI